MSLLASRLAFPVGLSQHQTASGSIILLTYIGVKVFFFGVLKKGKERR